MKTAAISGGSGQKQLSLVGVKKGLLTVIEQLPNKNNRTQFLCLCECGTERIIPGKEINRRKSRFIKCYCHKKPTMEFRDHPLYDVWKGMKARCYQINNIGYKNYGARGITVCDQWRKDFFAFYNWCLINGWKPGMQIDKDIKGGNEYSPTNCTVVTPVINARNSRHTKLTMEKALQIRNSAGRRADLAAEYSVCIATINQIKQGRIWKQI